MKPLRLLLLKIALWIYAVTGTLHFLLYSGGSDVVVRHATGLLWVLMMAAPALLSALVSYTIAKRFDLL
ncbi:hypothetical protein [uncultured Variovorax sp.]|uniref:hypothetical protein n=1 Tax=uncultured Variovorax sp. TaxID=114708 RepID=UPI00261F5839|nr:hypothetical protein [uncultured Variovorax sp.]